MIASNNIIAITGNICYHYVPNVVIGTENVVTHALPNLSEVKKEEEKRGGNEGKFAFFLWKSWAVHG